MAGCRRFWRAWKAANRRFPEELRSIVPSGLPTVWDRTPDRALGLKRPYSEEVYKVMVTLISEGLERGTQE